MSDPVEATKVRLKRLLETLGRAFAERDELLHLSLLTLLSGQHVLLLGPPGVGKSQVARALAASFEVQTRPLRYFEYVLTRFSHPDEILGPLSIPALREGSYERVSEGYLPWAELAFLDELFKANSALLNSFLSILNERVLHVGAQRHHLPLVAMVAASNEGPGEDEALVALYDRFLLRLRVEPIQNTDAFLKVALGETSTLELSALPKVSLDELARWRESAFKLPFSEGLKPILGALREALGVEAPSVRRWRQAMQWLQMAAFSSGQSQVEAGHLWLLERVLGDEVQGEGKVRQVLKRTFEKVLREQCLLPCQEAFENLREPHSAPSLDQAAGLQMLRVQSVRACLVGYLNRLEDYRRNWLSQVQALIWFANSADVSARLLTICLSVQAKLDQALGVLNRYGMALGEGADAASWLRRARQAQGLRLGEQAREESIGIWIALPEQTPEQWIPVSESGWLLVEAAPRLAGRIQRELNEQAQATGQSTLSWWEKVPHLRLDASGLWALSKGGGTLQRWLETQPLSMSAQAALVSLGAWLRDQQVNALPEVPLWPQS